MADLFRSIGKVIKPYIGHGDIPVNMTNSVSEDNGTFDFQNLLNTLTGVSELDYFNADEAKKQRDWQENMMNTQYQRTVADMQAAGINPAALTSGAQLSSLGSGASASSVGSQAGSTLNAIAKVISSVVTAIGNATKPSKILNIIK